MGSIDYGQDYDFSKPFFKQFRELWKKFPRASLIYKVCKSRFCNISVEMKNCYLVIADIDSEDSIYCNKISLL